MNDREISSIEEPSWWNDWNNSDSPEAKVFAVTPTGLIYHIDPFGEKSSILKNYFYTNYPVCGVAVKNQKEVNGSSESLSSESVNSYAGYVFYTIKNLDNNMAHVCAFKGDGSLHGEYIIPAYDEFISLECWPSDDNFLIAITRKEFYFIDLDATPPSVTITVADRPLDKGLALYNKINDYQCLFGVPDPKWPRGINHFILNRNNYSATFSYNNDYAIDENGPSLPMHVRGIGFYDGKLISCHQKRDGDSFLCFYNNDERNCTDFIHILITDIAIPIAGLSEKQPDVHEQVITVTTRQYDSSTGDYLSDIKELNMVASQPNKQFDHKVIDLSSVL